MRLIDADALIEYLAMDFGCHSALYDGTRLGATQLLVSREDVISAIRHNMPTIEAEPVRHSYWTRDGECNDCGELGLYNGNEELVRARWCPHCGAKMDGGAEDGW